MTFVAIVFAVLLAALHLFARRMRFLDGVPRSRLLSAGGGISVAYVFVQLLPELAEAAEAVRNAVIDRPVYLLALVGLAAFYAVERTSARHSRRTDGDEAGAATWFSFATYAVYNGVIGYLLVREHDEVIALLLFAIAMGVHFVVNDRGLRERHERVYHRVGRWLIAATVVVGALIGAATEIPEAVIGMLIAFIAGGVILNVMKEELPAERESSLEAFLAGAAAYTVLLLGI